MSTHTVTVDADPEEKMEVVCEPFEPQFPNYQGEKLLAIRYRGEEESFVVLSATQALELAQLLTDLKEAAGR